MNKFDIQYGGDTHFEESSVLQSGSFEGRS